jgi:MraZ protein
MHPRVEKWWTVVNNISRTIFIGEYSHAADAKGRVAVPTQFRAQFSPQAGARLVLVRGADDCIEAHTLPEWQEHFVQKMESLPLYDERALRIRRSRLASAREVELDGQGRILIPKNLRELAGIEDAAVVLGVGPFFELWNPGRYQRYLQAADGHYRADLHLLDGGATGKETGHDRAGGDVPRPRDGE